MSWGSSGRKVTLACEICGEEHTRPEETIVTGCPACVQVLYCLNEGIDPAEYGVPEDRTAVVIAAIAAMMQA